MPIKKEDAINKAMRQLMTPAPPGSDCYNIMKLLETIVLDLYQAGYDNGHSHAQAEKIINSATNGEESKS